MAEPTVRSFVAIALADPARSAVAEYLTTLRATRSGVAWSRPEQLHLTLKFLGNVSATQIPRLAERLRSVADRYPSFPLEVTGVGAFPSVIRPRTLWVGVVAPALSTLASAVDDACAAEGFAVERRPFHPHVTLGRVRERGRSAAPGGSRPRGAPSSPDLTFIAADGARRFGAASATDLVLFRSELGSGGSRYVALAALPFRR